jgi:hypothetical protein
LQRFRGLAALGHLGVEAIVHGVFGARVEVAVAVKREADRGMAGSDGRFLRARSGGDPERDGGVAQVVRAEVAPFRWEGPSPKGCLPCRVSGAGVRTLQVATARESLPACSLWPRLQG